jgi:NADH-quinone oxidoreductase subunit L
MYEAIVFLPLLGALIAGAIALVGASNRFPGASPPPDDDHVAAISADHPHAAAAPSAAANVHAEEAEMTPDAGSQAAELITTTLLAISWVLS